ncbi:MAG TPA: formylglycine-generating enzyme family protein [Polyangiaceae bacterium]
MRVVRFEQALLFAGLLSVSACTADFTGYRLEASAGGSAVLDAGAAGASSPDGSGAGSGGTTELGGAPANGGHGGVTANGAEAGVGDDAGSSAAGGTSAVAGAGGNPLQAQPSCQGLASTCGPDGHTSCCAASLVAGGSYNRSNLAAAPATVSDFVLDNYEVSVGRFRNFVNVYTQDMTANGAGKNPSDLGRDPGWNSAWNSLLPATGALATVLQCPKGSFTAVVGANESLPVTCVSWYEAFAFCIWDGGRLPTEAEWNYAAAGGSEERAYPWGSTAPDDAHAVFCTGTCGPVQPAGAKAPLGNGKWGQVDLVGNAWEWNLDVYATSYLQTSCVDCANTTWTPSSLRVFRGGSAGNPASVLFSATRNSRIPSDHNGYVGLRCARNP